MIYAVLAGINQYVDAPLTWCIKDIDDVYAFLQANGLEGKNASVLKDSAASKKAILSALKKRISALKAGDVLYFHYSGHGTQVPNKADSWEADGMDEALAPYFEEYHPSAFITDNEIFQIFSLKHPESFIIFTPDSCHSGDMGRNIKRASGNSKFLKLPEWLKKFFSTGSFDSPQPPKPSELKSYAYSLANVVVVSACDAHQVAQDGGAGIQNGRFTDALLRSLRQNPAQTFEELVLDLQARCKFAQTPQLQCAKLLRKRTFLQPKPVKSRKSPLTPKGGTTSKS